MVRVKRDVAKEVAAEQGKHFCKCGCGQVIVVTYNHIYYNGIPKYIKGHREYKRPRKYDFLGVGGLKTWIAAEQGKHFCKCGCNEAIIIAKQHYSIGIPKYILGHEVRIRKYPEVEQRFWEKVNKKGMEDCWLWKAYLDYEGYGHICTRIPCVKGLAHRLSYFLHHGEIPSDAHVLHNCPGKDNPSCVNPNHLFLGTHTDNMEDAARKGRFGRKLNKEKVLSIVKMIHDGHTRKEVKDLFDIGDATLCWLLKGKIWSWVTGIKED